jgi:hypothetical protein
MSVKLKFTTDAFGKRLLLGDNGTQVMMEWEKPYMEACIDKLKPSGRVLEVGFGLGYSASRIQTYEDVEEHVIIECSPDVWEEMGSFLEKYPKARLEKGTWQDVLPGLGKFDCVFFDDCTTVIDENRWRNGEHFLAEILLDHTDIGARIVRYSEYPVRIDETKVRLEQDEYGANVPSNCRYFKGNKLFIPLFTKTGTVSEEDLKGLATRPISELPSTQQSQSPGTEEDQTGI